MAKIQSNVSTLDDDAAPAAAAEVAAAPAVKVSANDVDLSGKRVTVTIHPTEGEGGSDAVFVSLNGYAYQIPRGKPVSLPTEVFEILKNSKTTHLQSGEGGKVFERTVQRFAFSQE